ncbi:MAG: glycine/betaine ABC transporter substrate-binding protein [Lachnospiraceae bacterium]|nr:glycine/betaine ABC transporter substrate-binding protein [Lachnospiraceae bacterium]
MKKATALAALVLAAAMFLCACGSKTDGKPVVRFSSKQFSESRIVAEVYALALEDAGIPIERMFGVSAIQEAIAAGEIDIYPEYTGTGLIVVLGLDPLYDPQEVYDTVKKGYAEKLNITWLDYAEANDGEGLVIRTDVAEALNIYTISDLQKHAGEIRIATQGEFEEREDGQKALEKVYGPFEWKSLTVYSDALKYDILDSNEADLAPAYTTEAYLTLPQFTLLEDDKHVWPPYNIAPIVRNEILEAYPEIADVCNAISKTLTTEVVTSLNARVDLDGEEPADVARDYYESIKK